MGLMVSAGYAFMNWLFTFFQNPENIKSGPFINVFRIFARFKEHPRAEIQISPSAIIFLKTHEMIKSMCGSAVIKESGSWNKQQAHGDVILA